MGKVIFGKKRISDASGSQAEPFISTVSFPLFPEPEIEVEKEIVYIDRPVDRIVEVIKEVPIEVIREVTNTVEVIKEVPIEVEKIVEKEVIKTQTLIKEVPIEVIKFIDRLDVRFKIPKWAFGIMTIEAITILALIIK